MRRASTRGRRPAWTPSSTRTSTPSPTPSPTGPPSGRLDDPVRAAGGASRHGRVSRTGPSTRATSPVRPAPARSWRRPAPTHRPPRHPRSSHPPRSGRSHDPGGLRRRDHRAVPRHRAGRLRAPRPGPPTASLGPPGVLHAGGGRHPAGVSMASQQPARRHSGRPRPAGLTPTTPRTPHAASGVTATGSRGRWVRGSGGAGRGRRTCDRCSRASVPRRVSTSGRRRCRGRAARARWTGRHPPRARRWRHPAR